MTVKPTPTRSRRQQHTQDTRAALLQSAKRLFAKRGFGATSIDDVADAARVTKGAVYHHFQNKSELFEAVFKAEQTRLMSQVLAATRSDANAKAGTLEQLLAGIDAFIDGCIADNDHRALLLQASSALGPERCRAIDEALALPAIALILQQLMAEGAIVQLPVEMLARILFSALCEAAMTAAARDQAPASQQEASQVLRSIVTGLVVQERK
jgi:AcrR family transcriptional regulator